MLFTARNKLGIHVIQLVNKLFTHCLTQVITLTSRKVGYFTRQKHHLLLIYRDAVRVLEVFLHAREVVGNGLYPVFTFDKLRDIFHRTRTIQGVHRNQVLKGRGVKFAEILLHTRRFELEGSDSPTITIKIVSGRILDGDHVNVHFYSK